jgi:hypothetical protein
VGRGKQVVKEERWRGLLYPKVVCRKRFYNDIKYGVQCKKRKKRKRSFYLPVIFF